MLQTPPTNAKLCLYEWVELLKVVGKEMVEEEEEKEEKRRRKRR